MRILLWKNKIQWKINGCDGDDNQRDHDHYLSVLVLVKRRFDWIGRVHISPDVSVMIFYRNRPIPVFLDINQVIACSEINDQIENEGNDPDEEQEHCQAAWEVLGFHQLGSVRTLGCQLIAVDRTDTDDFQESIILGAIINLRLVVKQQSAVETSRGVIVI